MDKMPLEELKTTATELLGTLRKLLKDTSVRRVLIKHPDGKVIVDLPLFLGLASALFLPLWTMIALIAGTSGGYTISVERDPGGEAEHGVPPSGPTDAPRPTA